MDKFVLELSSLQEAFDGHQKDHQIVNTCVGKREGACSHKTNFTFGWGGRFSLSLCQQKSNKKIILFRKPFPGKPCMTCCVCKVGFFSTRSTHLPFKKVSRGHEKGFSVQCLEGHWTAFVSLLCRLPARLCLSIAA